MSKEEKKIIISVPIFVPALDLEEQNPYFFKNTLVDEKQIFIAQPVKSIEDGLYVLDKWNREKYNIGPEKNFIYSKSSIINIPYVKYIYHSNTNITSSVHMFVETSQKKMKKDTTNSHQNKILVFQSKQKLFILALLPI